MAKKRIRTRSKSNKRRPYKKRTQKKRKKSTKRGGAADDPFPEQGQGRPRPRERTLTPHKKAKPPPIPSNIKGKKKISSFSFPEERVVEPEPHEEGEGLTRTTTVRREDIPPINQVEWGSLDSEKKELAESLGWVDMKDNDLLIKGPKSYYEWRSLDYHDQDKAITLGYNEKSWNEIGERRLSEQFPERGDQPFRRTDSDVTVGEGELQRETTPVLPGNTEEVERLIRNLISLLREEYKKYVDKYYSNENKTPEEKKQDYMDFLDEYYDIILNKEEDLIRLLQ